MIRNKINPLIHIVSDDSICTVLEKELTFYFGIDPTGSGIHIGHLIVMKLAADLLQQGHKLIVLIGGFTGQVGDPTGRTDSRKVLSKADAQDFASSILEDIQNFFKPYENVTYVNNKEWLSNMSLAEYAQIAQKISINSKLSMETYKTRIENRQHLSGLEFLYSDLQLIDFYYLHKKYNCTLQIGGQDQCGNILFGVRNMKYFVGKPCYGICTPLITNQGKKIGKSDSGTVLVRDHINFYNFFLSLPDVTTDQIAFYMSLDSQSANPVERKKDFMEQIYKMCFHSSAHEYFKNAQEKNSINFYSSISDADENFFISAPQGLISSICVECKILASKSEFSRLLVAKGIRINGDLLTVDRLTSPSDKFKISIGKKKHYFIRVQ